MISSLATVDIFVENMKMWMRSCQAAKRKRRALVRFNMGDVQVIQTDAVRHESGTDEVFVELRLCYLSLDERSKPCVPGRVKIPKLWPGCLEESLYMPKAPPKQQTALKLHTVLTDARDHEQHPRPILGR
jgi:hypothetical protein